MHKRAVLITLIGVGYSEELDLKVYCNLAGDLPWSSEVLYIEHVAGRLAIPGVP